MVNSRKGTCVTDFCPFVNFRYVELKQIISEQIENHWQLNLLHRDADLRFAFSNALQGLLKRLATGDLSGNKTKALIRYTCEAAVSSFYRINQYYQFDDNALEALYRIYEMLIAEVRESSFVDYSILARKHFLRIQEWLVTNEPDASLLFPAGTKTVGMQVVCAEYSADVQCRTLNLDSSKIISPLLDIGCGHKHSLVNHLRELGVDAFGIDRKAEPNDFIQRIGWLDFDYGENRWGSVVSHLAFSNHFRHQHYRKKSNHARYATVYMRILHSLQPGGSFYYAPDLPFIEVFLDPNAYQVVRRNIPGTPFHSVSVTRLLPARYDYGAGHV